MRKLIWRSGLMTIAVALSLAGGYMATVHAQDAAAPQPALEPILNSHQLMEAFFEKVHESLSDTMKAEPQDARGWKTIRSGANSIAELSNLVLIRKEYDDLKTWYDMTTAMKSIALELAKAAEEKNFATASDRYKALVESCNACHKKFEPETGPVIEP